MARLASERGEAEPQQPGLPGIEPETEEPTAEVAGDPDVDGGEVGEPDEAQGELDPDSEAVEEDGAAEPEEEASTGELESELEAERERVKHLQAELSRQTANRKERERLAEEGRTKVLQLGHALQDRLRDAESLAGYGLQGAQNALQQLQNVNPTTLTQDQFAQYQQQLQQAQGALHMHNQVMERAQKQRQDAEAMIKQREAEIGLAQIQSHISDWNGERYQQIADTAGEYGYTAQEFADNTDARLVIVLNELQQYKQAAQAVGQKVSKTKKTQPPKRRANREQARNADGKFAKAQREFQETRPGTRGSFAKMKAQQLATERRR